MMRTDTVCAPATAAGRSGICIIRVSGPEAHSVLGRIFRPLNGKSMPLRELVLGDIYSGKSFVDRCLAVRFSGPSSFTGEDTAEIQAHGGTMTVKRIIDACLEAGAVMAEPGEFSRRAFMNGKMDISSAEAVQDLIGSVSEKSAEISARNMRGDLFCEIRGIQDRLKNVLARMQAGIEYPEEDLEDVISSEQKPEICSILSETGKLISSFRSGRALREGVHVAITGAVNVGKSSFINRVFGSDIAIVTDIPGTTRDVISETYVINGLPVIFSDTAGLRDTDDEVERIGVEKARSVTDDAALVLFMTDGSADFSEDDLRTYLQLAEKKDVILAVNKCDRGVYSGTEAMKKAFGCEPYIISAQTGFGIDKLLDEIYRRVIPDESLIDGIVVSNARHVSALMSAERSLADAAHAIDSGISLDCVTIDLNDAWQYFGEITGETLTEEIIDTIFSSFCLGK